MPHLPLRLQTLVQELPGGGALAEAIGFETHSQFHSSGGLAAKELSSLLVHVARQTTSGALYQQRVGDEPRASWLTVEVPPPRRQNLWRSAFPLRVNYALWRHDQELSCAWAPALSLQVIASSEQGIEPQLRSAILHQLAASHPPIGIRDLLLLQRQEAAELRSTSVTIETTSLKQAAQRQANGEEPKDVVQLYDVLDGGRLPQAYEVDDAVELLARSLQGRNPRNVLLVGPSGAGKTALVQQLVRDRARYRLAHSPFWSTSGARLVAGAVGYGMWQERCELFVRKAEKEKAIVHLGNLLELTRVGQSASDAQNIGGYLASRLQRGRLLAIAECTPQQLAIVERDHPQLLEAFLRQPVSEPDKAKGWRILQSCAEQWSAERDVVVDQDALRMIDRLHRRYATYSAYPGRPLRFLGNMMCDAVAGRPVGVAQVAAAFVQETGLPDFLIRPEVVLDLDATRGWFRQRLMGQDHAIELVLDVLAAVKAELARPGRPLASLLLIGPTGVGKTEMAKCLAELLYGARHRMIRLDMSEYADPSAAQRLFGGGGREEGGVLTAQVREQPFSVLLLDELEKTHHVVLDLLLQVLGEGRLTDGQGQVADFTNSVILMTSNLGADSFGRPAAGFRAAQVEDHASLHFTKHVREFFRPEMYNRIDRVVPFLPLCEDVIRDIAQRELELARRREGLRHRPVELHVAPEVLEMLAARGFEPRYGARPLKRTLERELLIPLANGLNQYQDQTALQATASLDGDHVRVHVQSRPKTNERDVGLGQGADELSLPGLVQQVSQQRRRCQRVLRGPAMLELLNELERLRRIELRAANRREKNEFVWSPRQAAITRVETLARRLQQARQGIFDVEDRVMLAHYLERPLDLAAISHEIASHRQAFGEAMLDLFLRNDPAPDEIAVLVFGPRRWVRPLVLGLADLIASDANYQAYGLYPFRPEWDTDNQTQESTTSPGEAESRRTSRRARRRSALFALGGWTSFGATPGINRESASP